MPYTKKRAIEIVRDYFGCTKREAKRYVGGLSPYDCEVVREMDKYLQTQGKLAFYND